MQNILLTNRSLTYFAGSELATLDLAIEFKKRGFVVYVASFDSGGQMRELFDAVGVKWVDLSGPFFFNSINFDLMIGHHFTTFDRVLVEYGVVPNKVVYMSLSPYEPLECPPLYANELTAVYANSKETSMQLSRHGIDDEMIAIFENSVHDDFFEVPLVDFRVLRRIAVVSNHVPSELTEAAGVLGDEYRVDFFGIENNPVLITKELLGEYDLVVTIGRTVQMCLALGIPVYCYDRFGGPGYLDEQNFERAATYNFSGRCCKKQLDAYGLASDIIERYSLALNYLSNLREKAHSRYLLSDSVNSMLGFIDVKSSFSGIKPAMRETISRQIEFYRSVDKQRLQRIGELECASGSLSGWDGGSLLGVSNEDYLSKKTSGRGGARMLAFYLPQFHAITENDSWWGKNFTEWDNVRQGKPLFDGHYQPHEPGELGYYDLSDVSVLDKQARLAHLYGIEGFCFYYYWFDGKRLLEKPVDQLLQHPEIDLPFCLCWANENWTRRWDGGEQEILMQQSYAPENHQRFAQDMLPYLRDSRYICVNGKPLILIYRADIIPDLKNTVSAWRTTWLAEGVGEVYLVCVESFTTRIPQADGFDAACEFFPHQIDFSQMYPDDRPLNLCDPRANIADYSKLAAAQENRPNPGYKCFRGVVPSWDNASRRRKGGATLFINSSPERYETWLEKAVSHTLVEYDGDERLVFINAWNEWGEGCHLEPDARYGRAYLEATQRGLVAGEKIDVEFHRNVLPYQEWLATRKISPADLEWAQARLINETTFTLTVVVDATACTFEQLGETLQSLDLQQYEHLQVIVVSSLAQPDNVGDKLSWLQLAEFPDFLLRELAQAKPQQWLCLVRGGDLVCENALILLALHVQDHPEAGLVYVDEDVIDPRYAPSNPQFKPDFDLDYLRSYPYIGRFLFVRGREYLAVNGLDFSKGFACFYDYVLRFSDQYGANAISHLPEVVFHGIALPQESDIYARHATALWSHLQRRGIQADLQPGLYPGSFRVQYRHPSKPKVSIIVPTRDKVELLSRCVESLLEKTTYPDFEILIVDNQSSNPEALQFLQGLQDLGLPNVRVLYYPHPFNFSAMNNLAVQAARGEYLVLLNNDTAIVKSDWLDALLNHAQRPEVGVVGAKLLYPDGKVQHAGVVLGLRGPADHPFIGEVMDSPGYAGRLLVDQQYSAVTAACMMVRKSIYEQVGGLDADVFKVSYNDVDFCLKVKKAGFGIVWTPYSVVMHEGSVSQKQVDQTAFEAKQQRFESEQLGMYRKWMPELISDPAYNPNLSLSSSGFELETNTFVNPPIITDVPRILVHPADHFGSGSYRIIWPLQAMEQAGSVVGLCADTLFDPIHIAKSAPDVIVCQRQLTDEQLRHMKQYREFSEAKIVYELDDYLPNLPVGSIHKAHMPKDVLRRMRRAAALCDRVVVSTAALKNALHDLHTEIVVAPNYLPVWLWGDLPKPQRPDFAKKIRIGWVGGGGHGGDLNMIADVVQMFAGRVEWVFMGMLPNRVERSMVEWHPGVPVDNYPAYMAALNLDLALAPLEENLFNECKSNLRLLEYGACGFPVIASDIEPYRCGLPVTLVKNRFKDWVDAIETKLQNRDALWQEGMQLQQSVREYWMLRGENVQRWQEAWIK